MSNTPIMYSSHDVGAPQVKDVSVDNRLAQSLKNIIVPALVTGYGDRSAAGWKLIHEHEFGFTLSNGDGTFFVNFVSNLPAQSPYPAINQYTIHVYAATSFTGADGAKMQGANLCSSSYRYGIFESSKKDRHQLGYSPYRVLWSNRSEAIWSIVADSKTFVLNLSTLGSIDSPTSGSLTIYAGEASSITPVATNIVIGGDAHTYNDFNNASGLGRGYTLPINPLNGLSENITVGVYPDSRLYSRSSGDNYKYRNHIDLYQPFLLAGDQWFGKLRGIVNDPMIAEYSNWRDYLIQLGFDPDFNNRNKPIEIDGNLYCYARHASCGGMYMTTNPVFW